MSKNQTTGSGGNTAVPPPSSSSSQAASGGGIASGTTSSSGSGYSRVVIPASTGVFGGSSPSASNTNNTMSSTATTATATTGGGSSSSTTNVSNSSTTNTTSATPKVSSPSSSSTFFSSPSPSSSTSTSSKPKSAIADKIRTPSHPWSTTTKEAATSSQVGSSITGSMTKGTQSTTTGGSSGGAGGGGGGGTPNQPPPPPPPRPSPLYPPRGGGFVMRNLRRIGRIGTTSLALIGFAGVVVPALYREFEDYQKKQQEEDDNDKHNKYALWKAHDSTSPKEMKPGSVLVIPFWRMKLVETKKAGGLINPSDLTSSPGNSRIAKDTAPITMEVKQLVKLIHEAASDENVVALYGDFGDAMENSKFEIGGLAHVEEIRRAIRLFNESHRRHYEPSRSPKRTNTNTDTATTKKNPPKKFSVAYAQTFGSFDSAGNIPYLLASSFQDVKMNSEGYLHLFGVGTGTVFLKGFLDKYGIKAHVFKHGDYKNAPNMLTHRLYNKEHLESTKSMINSLDESVRDMINISRFCQDRTTLINMMLLPSPYRNAPTNTYPLPPKTFDDIYLFGPLNSEQAAELGLVSIAQRMNLNKESQHKTMPSILDQFIGEGRRMEESMTLARNTTTTEVASDHLSNIETNHLPTRSISLMDYSRIVAQRDAKAKTADEKEWRLHSMLTKLSNIEPINYIMANMGIVGPYFNINKREYTQRLQSRNETIAIVHIKGGINSNQAQEVTSTLNQIKQLKMNAKQRRNLCYHGSPYHVEPEEEKEGNNNNDNDTDVDPHLAAIIVRVDSPGGSAIASETILTELKSMGVPIICSMGNVAASGGYYVAAHSNKIFALPTTITGSIGAFLVKFDATKMARDYGIHAQYVTKGPHSVGMSPLVQLSKEMRDIFDRSIKECYDRFKTVVMTGRDIPSPMLMEHLAQGKVYTGIQAKDVGLVDELGGLDRAIAYAQKHYTNSGEAQVKVFPQQEPLWQRLMDLLSSSGGERSRSALFATALSMVFDELYSDDIQTIHSDMTTSTGELSSQKWLIDLLSPKGIQYLLNDGSNNERSISSSSSLSMLTPMLTMDENEALRATLEDLCGSGHSQQQP